MEPGKSGAELRAGNESPGTPLVMSIGTLRYRLPPSDNCQYFPDSELAE